MWTCSLPIGLWHTLLCVLAIVNIYVDNHLSTCSSLYAIVRVSRLRAISSSAPRARHCQEFHRSPTDGDLPQRCEQEPKRRSASRFSPAHPGGLG
jgi:hypothetical protein